MPIPVDDGSAKPLGYVSSDGELEVRDNGDGTRGYHETALGQTQRWIRQAPDLYALYIAVVEENAQIRAGVEKVVTDFIDRNDNYASGAEAADMNDAAEVFEKNATIGRVVLQEIKDHAVGDKGCECGHLESDHHVLMGGLVAHCRRGKGDSCGCQQFRRSSSGTVFVLLDDKNEPIKVFCDRAVLEQTIKGHTEFGFQEVPIVRRTTLRTGAEPKSYAAIPIEREGIWIVVDLGIQKVMARCDEQADCELIVRALNHWLVPEGTP